METPCRFKSCCAHQNKVLNVMCQNIAFIANNSLACATISERGNYKECAKIRKKQIGKPYFNVIIIDTQKEVISLLESIFYVLSAQSFILAKKMSGT